jgi:hypothetical protein
MRVNTGWMISISYFASSPKKRSNRAPFSPTDAAQFDQAKQLAPFSFACSIMELISGLWRFADKIRSVISVSGSLVSGHLRVRTKRTGTVHSSVREMGREDLLRCSATRNPMLDGRHLVECVGAGTAPAMVHAGHHVQLDGFADHAFAKLSDHIVEIIDW